MICISRVEFPQIIIIPQKLKIQGCDTGVKEGWPSSTNVLIRKWGYNITHVMGRNRGQLYGWEAYNLRRLPRSWINISTSFP